MGDKQTLLVVRKAMQLFWQKGTGVALSEIVAATGLNRKALYGRFGDKATLVGAALGLYRQEVLDPMVALLEGSDGGTHVYWDTAQRSAKLPSWRGCLLVRAALTDARGQPHVQDAFEAYLNHFVASMEDACIREGNTEDPHSAAWSASAFMISVSVLAASKGYNAQVDALFRAARTVTGTAMPDYPELSVSAK